MTRILRHLDDDATMAMRSTSHSGKADPRNSEELLRDVLDSVASNVAVLDGDGVIHTVNRSWQQFALQNGTKPGDAAQRTETGVNYLDVCRESTGNSSEGAAEAHDGIRAVLDRRLELFSLEYPCDSPHQGRWFVMHASTLRSGRHGAVVIHTDITARKHAEAELEKRRDHLERLVIARTIDLEKAYQAAEVADHASVARLRTESAARMQSRKMEAIGTLAAGIAHDFNNILGSIVGFAEMTGDDLPDGSIASQNIRQILIASFRGRDIVARMLDFARQRQVQPVAVEIVAQVEVALALLRAFLPPSVSLSFRSGMGETAAPACILADPTQIQQVVMNLCINAAYAMHDHGSVGIGIDPCDKVKGVPPGYCHGICLTVTDSGDGMTPEVLTHMFDPFFTTKKPGKGSGLGLSVVHDIVTNLGGAIEVQSRVDSNSNGSEFRVFLPLAIADSQTGEVNGAHSVD